MAKLEKKLGNKAACPSCNTTIVCREKAASGNYPAKLQWQNEDGKAHYNFDFQKQEGDPDRITCNSVEVEDEQEKIDDTPAPEKTPEAKEYTEFDKAVKGHNRFLDMIENATLARFANNKITPSGERLGMRVKLIWETINK